MTTLPSEQSTTIRTFNVYFGTYTTDSPARGIYHATLNVESGKLTPPTLACELSNPSFIAIHPDQKHLYTVTEKNPDQVSALFWDHNTKMLNVINQSPSGGQGPCHLMVSDNGKTLLVANYRSGSVAAICLNSDGSLGNTISIIQHTGNGTNLHRQKGPHAHSVNLSPDNRFAYVADLGTDQIMIYPIDQTTGKLNQNTPAFFKTAPGAGPRHFTFHPNQKFAYLINELDNTIVVLAHDKKYGTLTEIETVSTLPDDYHGQSFTAEIKVHPNGKFLYGSNRGHNSIVIYSINDKTGKLKTPSFQGTDIDEPRHFNIDPSGKYCVVGNQHANNTTLFKIDPATGLPTPTGITHAIGKPICIQFTPSSGD